MKKHIGNAPQTFALRRDGKIVFVPEAPKVPEKPYHLPWAGGGNKSLKEYKKSIRSAITNGIEVENQEKVKHEILNIYEPDKCTLSWCEGKSKIPGTDGCYNQCAKYKNIEEGKLHTLNCRVKIIQYMYAHSYDPYNTRLVARVTFDEDKPEQKEETQEELWREAESIVSASLRTYKISFSDKMAKWTIDELKKQFTLTRKITRKRNDRV